MKLEMLKDDLYIPHHLNSLMCPLKFPSVDFGCNVPPNVISVGLATLEAIIAVPVPGE